MRIGNFIPRVALRSENQTTITKTDQPSSETVEKDGQLFMGYGVEFKIPVTQPLKYLEVGIAIKGVKRPKF